MGNVMVCKNRLNHVVKCFPVEAWYLSIHSASIYFHNLQRMFCQKKEIKKMELLAQLTSFFKAHLIFTRKWWLHPPLRKCKCNHMGFLWKFVTLREHTALGKQSILVRNLASVQFSVFDRKTNYYLNRLFNKKKGIFKNDTKACTLNMKCL